MSDAHILIGSVTLENFIIFILACLVVIFSAYISYKIVKIILLRYTSDSVARWAARFAGYLVVGLGLYGIDLAFLGLDINATIASLGIISIALAFASQQIVSNLLAGFLITINRTIRLDDWVELGGDPTTGISRVKDLTFTRSVLKDRDGRVYLVPNATLLSSKIVNYSKSGFIEIPVMITLPLKIPFDEARTVILSVLNSHPDILPNGKPADHSVRSGIASSFFFQGYTGRKAKPDQLVSRVLFTGITAQGNTISIRFWIFNITRREEITSEILSEISKRLNIPEKM